MTAESPFWGYRSVLRIRAAIRDGLNDRSFPQFWGAKRGGGGNRPPPASSSDRTAGRWRALAPIVRSAIFRATPPRCQLLMQTAHAADGLHGSPAYGARRERRPL